MPYYAVAIGRKPGIYKTWDECKAQVDKFVRPSYKKFDSYDQAQLFVTERSTEKPIQSSKPAEKRKFLATDSVDKNIVMSKIPRIDSNAIIEVDSTTDIIKIENGMYVIKRKKTKQNKTRNFSKYANFR